MTSAAAVESLFQQGLRSEQAGHWQDAEAYYRQVLVLSPDHVSTLRNLAMLMFRFGAHDAAAELLTHATEVAPSAAELHDELGQVYAAKGAMTAAVRCFKQALVLRPDYAQAEAHLAAGRRELALAADDDYAELPGAPWTTSDSIWHEKRGGDVLLVTFAGLGIGRSPPTFIFRRFLTPFEHVDKLFVRDISLNWYLRGLPGITSDVANTAKYLERQTRGYGRTVFLGCSSGGMAALLYGNMVGADKVLAFAPQTTLALNKVSHYRDPRWEQRLSTLRLGRELTPYLDLAEHNPVRVAADIYYPAGSLHDCAHAERITGTAVKHCPQPGNSHLIALQMRDNGTLRPIIEREIRPPGSHPPTVG